MTLIALAADKGSPGVTTSAVALAAVWPRRALFAECDPHGGDLVYRMPADHGGPLDPNRGLVSLAVEARRGLDPGTLAQHTQRLRGGLEILVGLGNADQARGMTGLWPTLGRALDRFGELPGGADVIADCGRIGPDSPSVDLLGQAGLVLLIARAEAEQIAHVRDRANSLSARLHASQNSSVSLARPPIGIVLIVPPGRAKETVKQVGDLLSATTAGAEVVGVIAYDETGAAALNGRARGRVDKALVTRSARELAATVSHRYGLLRPQAPQSAQPPQPQGRPAAYPQHPGFQPPQPTPPQPTPPQPTPPPQPAYAASVNAETMTSIPITPTSVTPGGGANGNGSSNPNSTNPYFSNPRGGATTAANLKSVPHPSDRTVG
ncbi:hypothetical protein [Actinospica robiniae]|uniref:hypothetical protein n=1 Tax=Actinospica robiniae TaxID=304901 RepID=UPI000404684B|nr:hypothetical protein [Actinospica robiniae]